VKTHSPTSWQKVGSWYDKRVGDKGLYYHEHIIIPHAVALLDLHEKDALLDLGCGQGILGRIIPKLVTYVGIDAASSLIKAAKQRDHDTRHQYIEGDITKPISMDKMFTHASIILALQNCESPQAVFKNVASHLVGGGKFLIVINHPSFRIPRQTGWGIDEQNKQQYRKVFRYASPQKIPITMHPGQPSSSPMTWTFHFPLSDYSKFLASEGFVIERIEEWISDKESVGSAAKMENRGRSEIPLFMGILARKKE
jgi:ubiquinone/menaquinone biosynthesis C-methylase UbiE